MLRDIAETLLALAIIAIATLAGWEHGGKHLALQDQTEFQAWLPPTLNLDSTEWISPHSHKELKYLFDACNYNWGTLNQGVPPIVLTSLPPDLNKLKSITEKKRLFFLSLLPMVILINEEIQQERQILLELLEKHDLGEELTPDQLAWLQHLGQEYRAGRNPLDDEVVREKLLRRIDTLPPSMVLAQAANESAYGTSRFALLGNNLFGEWTFKPGSGIVPEGRPEGATYEVKRFPSVFDSVKSYMRNLNTHQAYRSLREERARLRAEGQPLSGLALAEGLGLYSERQDEYIREVKTIIKQNRLPRLTGTTLRCETVPSKVGPYRSTSFFQPLPPLVTYLVRTDP